MKHKLKNFYLFIVTATILFNCTGQKNLNTVTEKDNVQIPPALTKYKSDENYIRATTFGVDKTSTGAKSKAINLARKELMVKVESYLSNIVGSLMFYMNDQEGLNGRDEYNEIKRNALNSIMMSARIVDFVELEKGNNGKLLWVVMDIPKIKINDVFLVIVDSTKFPLKAKSSLKKIKLH